MNKTYLQLFSNCLIKPPVLFKILNEHKNLILPVIFLLSPKILYKSLILYIQTCKKTKTKKPIA